MDNYEWPLGFSWKYGIARVDPHTLDRIPKKSATWYANVIAAHRARHGAAPTGEKESTGAP
jgi:beta-glucosidase